VRQVIFSEAWPVSKESKCHNILEVPGAMGAFATMRCPIRRRILNWMDHLAWAGEFASVFLLKPRQPSDGSPLINVRY
jgi:hypothetical protein